MASARRIVRILTHGHCFDGLVSAALATKLAAQLVPELPPDYRSLGYGARLKRPKEQWLDGMFNVLTDFRYVESPGLNLYFDHHPTAFSSEAELLAARNAVRRSGGKRSLYFDQHAKSCASVIAHEAPGIIGSSLGFEELIRAADQIDSADFASAEKAFFAHDPSMQIADVTERFGDADLLRQLVPPLLERSLAEVAALDLVRPRAAEIAHDKERHLATVREKARLIGDVVWLDLGDGVAPSAGKFAVYVAFPRCTYSVVLLGAENSAKLAVGYNPWGERPRRHDLSLICAREGGGGHAQVGGVHFASVDVARRVGEQIAQELAGS